MLCLLDAESLKEVGIATIGQRLAILKAVYQLKIANNVPIEPDHYIPPCMSLQPVLHPRSDRRPAEVEDRSEQPNVDKLFNLLREQGMLAQCLPYPSSVPSLSALKATD